MTNSPEFERGYFTCGEDISRFINSLDTETMTKKEIRSAIFRKCIDRNYEWGVGRD